MRKILEGIANNPSNLDLGRGPNHRVAQIEESEVLRKLLERVDMLENAKIVSFQPSPPPLFEDPTIHESNSSNNGGSEFHGSARLPRTIRKFWPREVISTTRVFPTSRTISCSRSRKVPKCSSTISRRRFALQPNARKHENFSYSNPKAAVQFSPGFEPGAKPPNNEGRPSIDEMLSLIYKEMKEMREQDAKVNEYMKSNSSQIKNMEFQIGQLATTVGHM
ncbi:hypothetical protein ACS0TY_002590 [Phlomoides rotata]